MNWTRLAFAVAWVALVACTGAPAKSAADGGDEMTPKEAEAVIADARTERGMPPVAHAPVTSADQLLAILDGDEIGRFEDAAAFVAGKPGIDAMALHAKVQLAWSDGFSTVAVVVNELGKRAQVEVDRLGKKKDSGRELSSAEQQALDRAEHEVEFDARVAKALTVLSRDHLQQAESLLSELLRQFPKDVRTYRVASFYYVLREDWNAFDTSMTWLKGEEDGALVEYLRAMEALRRFAIKKEAREKFVEALAHNPKLVRVQAKLVLVQEEIPAAYAELEKLRVLAPRHPVVTIAGPSIESEYKMSEAVQKARASEGSTPGP